MLQCVCRMLVRVVALKFPAVTQLKEDVNAVVCDQDTDVIPSKLIIPYTVVTTQKLTIFLGERCDHISLQGQIQFSSLQTETTVGNFHTAAKVKLPTNMCVRIRLR